MVACAIGLAWPALADANPTRALVVLPPGEGDTITLSGYAQNQVGTGCDGLGPHYCDQSELYSNWGFRNGALSADAAHVPGAASSEQPTDGVTIVRDSDGVPHVFGTGPDEATIEGRLAFGIGYAQAEERLFQMEILRRAAEGRLSIPADGPAHPPRLGDRRLAPGGHRGARPHRSGLAPALCRRDQRGHRP